VPYGRLEQGEKLLNRHARLFDDFTEDFFTESLFKI
jgi:hypothetical protein